MSEEVLIYSRTIISPQGQLEGVIVIQNGIIQEIVSIDEVDNTKILDYADYTIIPGLIDTHVHVNEPGRTEWEGFETATKAAVRGGITTIMDMPLNSSPVTTTKQNLEYKLNQMTDKLYCNVGFHGGIVPESIDHVQELADEGVFAFKIFTINSGIDEFGYIRENKLKEVMERVKRVDGTLMVHAELEHDVQINGNPRVYDTYLSSRPRSWENNAIRLLIELMEETNCKVHIIHLSSSDVLGEIREAKKQGLPLTVETCPHYLYFNSETIEDGQTQFKCAPPIREDENREKLWDAVKSGIIDFIASDHSPSPPELKNLNSGNFFDAWGGIASLQFSFSAIWTEAIKQGVTLEQVVKLMAETPAKFLGLQTKGKLAPGYDADLVILDKDYQVRVKEELIEHKHKLTPYLGETLSGKIEATYIGGKLAYENSSSEFHQLQDPLLFKKEL